MNNRIIIADAITLESYAKFARRLLFLEHKLKPSSAIEIEISSHGGDAHAALAYYHKIRASKRTINTTGLGSVASAATLILLAGDHRRLASTGWVMVHEGYGEPGETLEECERSVKQGRRLENQWNQLFFERTGVNATLWEKLNKKTTWLTAEECLSYNVINEIVRV